MGIAYLLIAALAHGDDSLPADALQRLKAATVYVKTEIASLPLTGLAS